MTKVFAFVFARGGSKGLPRKNVLPLDGKPLLAHSIDVAKQVVGVDRIFVSSDDDEIKNIAVEFGAEIIDRPKWLASDNTPEIEAWKHAVSYLMEKGEFFDIFLSLPATSPLRNIQDIEACINALDERTDSVITVTSGSRNPYFNMVTKNVDGFCSMMFKSSGYSRRQDAPEAFDITTAAYVMRPDHILRAGGVLDGRVKCIEIPKERGVDIDDEWDYQFAKLLYKLQHKK